MKMKYRKEKLNKTLNSPNRPIQINVLVFFLYINNVVLIYFILKCKIKIYNRIKLTKCIQQCSLCTVYNFIDRSNFIKFLPIDMSDRISNNCLSMNTNNYDSLKMWLAASHTL